MDINKPVTSISGIGPKYANLLAKLEIKTIADLLQHIPFRYEDRSNIKKISQLMPGHKTIVIGKVKSITNIFTPNGKRLTKGIIEDETGELSLLWFNQHYLKKTIKPSTTISVFGEIDSSSKKPQFISPEWEFFDPSENQSTYKFLPIYNLTEGLNSKWIRKKVAEIIEEIKIEEIFPDEILETYNLIDRNQAYKQIHAPNHLSEADTSKYRLAFEELLFLHLKGLNLRKEWENKKNSHKITMDNSILNSFLDGLKFKPTNDQIKSIHETLDDLKNEIPMNRLLQGDVGSGKTLVAAVGLLACGLNRYNSIYLAPTQILAEQHYKTIKDFLSGHDIDILLLTGNEKKFTINANRPYIVIATHSVLYNLDLFSNIGLIVIDEQHKFGVEQRTIIVDHYTNRNKDGIDTIPNLLTMTATPIPRSLALTFYGDLDLSLINEMPTNRKPVKTWLINEQKRTNSYNWIKDQMNKHKSQVFVVCPFIEESNHEEFKNVKAAETEFIKLKEVFNEFKLGLLHGRLSQKEKTEIVNKFLQQKIDMLVTTPVIEVGIDIPNANIIFIETPERFGLASLHQLRGRVGRGGDQGYCILMQNSDGQQKSQRLKYMETVHNGNKLAEIDMQLRGPGDIYGTNQHGYINLKIADMTDIELIKTTKTLAQEVYKEIDNYKSINEILANMQYVEEN